MIKLSAQLAKWAAVRTRWALASPKPPPEKDKEARTCASIGSRRSSEDGAKTPPHSTVVPDCKLLCQIWSDGSQQEVGGPTHEEEEVGGLRVVDPWDPFEEGGMLSTLLHEELLDEFRVTYWDTQHPQSLLGRGEVWISLPGQRHLASPFWLPW